MISPQHVALMARYNRWMNGKLYAACGQLSDAQRKEDRGAFFKSIHGTLNHILWGDYTWIGRFSLGTALGKSYPKAALGTLLFEDWQELSAARQAMDTDILVWAETVDAGWLAQDFAWYSGLTQSARSKPAWLLVAHFFNHQTHHRGQATTLLSQCGGDVDATDLMLMPE